MRIIISPAKKMNDDTDSMSVGALPHFLPKTEQILGRLQAMSFDELKSLWKCNDKLAEQNFDRLRRMDLRKGLTPAILSYEGIQYQYMAPSVFSDDEYEYIQEHLRILSGFYGVLKPFDGVRPYRLEMQARLDMDMPEQTVSSGRFLYGFWGSSIAEHLAAETDCIVNLASKEYSSIVSGHLPEDCRMITCVFGEDVKGRIVEKGTLCKMARGEMVRRMADHRIEKPEQIRELALLNYRYDDELSDESTYVFMKKLQQEA